MPLLLLLLALVVLVQAGAYLVMIYEARRACAGAREKLPAHLWWPFALECLLVLPAVVCWAVCRLAVRAGRAPSLNVGGRPVVLVHDLAGCPLVMLPMAVRLQQRGWRTIAVTYPGDGADLYARASALASAIEAACTELGASRVDVVAHGVGGLLVRAAARFDGAAGRLGNVVTVGTPHQGTALASLVLGPQLAQIRPGSPFLLRLNTGDQLHETSRVTAIASSFDALVFPADSAYYPGAFNITVDGIGHLGMLVSGKVVELVAENLLDRGGPVQSQAA